VRIPSSIAAGSYYVLAKADWENNVLENYETNNTRTSGLIRIGPDLIVSALTAPATGAPGGAIVVSDTTRNDGTSSAEASTTRFYLSTNTLLDVSDVVLGARGVPPLTVGASSSATTAVTLPAATATGTYYILAVADASNTVGESTETNNTRISAGVRVGPDLLVTVIDSPALAAAGGPISIADTTANQGAAAAAASSTGFYLSTNGIFDASDVFLGSRPVGQLPAGAASLATTVLQIPANIAAGAYFVFGVADWNGTVAETLETNNSRMDSTSIGGDLLVWSLTVSGGGAANGPITVTDTTRNQGAPLPQSETGFFFSINSSFDAADVLLGSRAVPALATSATSTATTQLTVPAGTPPGSYWVIAVADWRAAVPESSENNNTRMGVIRVGPDLTVSIFAGPASAVAGTTISVSDLTRNQGGDTAASSITSYYLSAANFTLDAGDLLLNTRAVPSLAAGGSQSGSVSLLIPASTAAGTYYIIAKSDGDDSIAESLENNNTGFRSISVTAASP
jgi:subtilase family serine protease